MNKRLISIVKDSFCEGRNSSPILSTQNGLSFTPSEMMTLMEKGVPISTQTVGLNFIDGDFSNSSELLVDQHRGVDVADVWNANKDVRAKLRKGVDNDIQQYGLSDNSKSE